MAGWNDEITLIKTPTVKVDGFAEPGEPERLPVYANKKSVARSEFYSAKAAGARIDVIYEVHAEDFDEHTEIEDAAGAKFDVIRSFQTSQDIVELTCARR